MTDTDGDRQRIALFWRAIELFSPSLLPEADARSHVVDLFPGEPMPWESGSALGAVPVPPGKVWRHEVFGGVYDVGRVVGTLVRLFGDDDPADQREPKRGQSALFACTVDAEGLLVEESAVLSSCAWVVGRAYTGGRRAGNWLAGFDQDVLHFGDQLGKLTGADFGGGVRFLAASMREAVPASVAGGVKARTAGGLAPAATPAKTADRAASGEPAPPPARLDTHPLSGADVQRFADELATRLGVGAALSPTGVRVRSYLVSSARASETADSSFLNSFLAGDLARVAAALRKGDAGPGLRSYLTSGRQLNTRERTDVRLEPRAVQTGCQPERIPLGRWPANTDRPLVMGQQFAVNQILDQLADGQGLFAVNGPPGTGKTTMLRDLIAAIVAGRALRLAELADSHDAFSNTASYKWATVKMRHRIVAPRPELTGSEIVVASANNGAVENVTTEIPGPDGIGTEWRDSAAGAGYFPATAQLTCGDGAWAMVAAKLGNRSNCGEFVRAFWWGAAGDESHDGMAGVLKELETEEVDWAAAVARFREAERKVRALAAERQEAATAIERLAASDGERVRALTAVRDAEEACRRLERRGQEVELALARADAERTAARNACTEHRDQRPGLLVSVSTMFRAGRDWHADHLALTEKYRDAERTYGQVHQDSDALHLQISNARHAVRRARATFVRLDQQTEQWRDEIARAVSRWGAHVPAGPEDAAATSADAVERREKSAPWADEEFTTARTELFLAALRLHKDFITAEAPTIRRNLSALIDVLDGRGPRPPVAAALAAWQTFFLMVPVVSSAFASVDRLFTGFGRESLGWLLIDEAGQAAPQQAAGAIWRARRAVIVGDPIQLEPVVTMPWGGQEALRRLFGVAEEWAPSRTSVQRLADRLAPHGTWLPAAAPDGADHVWVGTPLRVHRRCDRPIFDICNEIAYDRLMVFGTAERGAFHGHDIWYDVESSDARGHWIPAEGAALRDVLAGLKDAGVPAASIRVISPFRQVVRGAVTVHRDVFPDGTVPPGQRDKWVGTVHRMQGREADVVILILGGQPDRPGARQWAAERPNLLNVAVTRARRRLYVIGSHRNWSHLPYFDVLAGRLPVWSPPAG